MKKWTLRQDKAFQSVHGNARMQLPRPASPAVPGESGRLAAFTRNSQDENLLVVVDGLQAGLERLPEDAVRARSAELGDGGVQDVLNPGDAGRIADAVGLQRTLQRRGQRLARARNCNRGHVDG